VLLAAETQNKMLFDGSQSGTILPYDGTIFAPYGASGFEGVFLHDTSRRPKYLSTLSSLTP